MNPMINGHILIQPGDGHKHGEDRSCLVCVGGLAICKNCNAAEVELDKPCEARIDPWADSHWEGDDPELDMMTPELEALWPHPKTHELRKAVKVTKKIISMLQGTMGLEGRGLDQATLRRMKNNHNTGGVPSISQ